MTVPIVPMASLPIATEIATNDRLLILDVSDFNKPKTIEYSKVSGLVEYAYMTTSELATSDAVNYTAIPALTQAVAVGEKWAFSGTFWVRAAATTTGVQVRCTGVTSPTGARYAGMGATSSTGWTIGSPLMGSQVTTAAVFSTTLPGPLLVVGYVIVGANAGTISWDFKSEIDASEAVVSVGSNIKYTKIP